MALPSGRLVTRIRTSGWSVKGENRSMISHYRISLLIGILIVVPVGYIVRFAEESYWSSTFGAIAYTPFWILLVQFLVPKLSPKWTTLGVLLMTCAIEFLQLWQPPFLQAIRATLPGRLILGNTFLWDDFPPYFVGCFLGWLLIKFLRHQFHYHH
jgi:glycopeptide antibiotics resistance protein